MKTKTKLTLFAVTLLNCLSITAQTDSISSSVVCRDRYGVFNYADIPYTLFVDGDTIFINEHKGFYGLADQYTNPSAIKHSAFFKVDNKLQTVDSSVCLNGRYLATYKINDKFYCAVTDTVAKKTALLVSDFLRSKKDSLVLDINLPYYHHLTTILPFQSVPYDLTEHPSTEFLRTSQNDFLIMQYGQLNDSVKWMYLALFDTLGNVLQTKNYEINQRLFANKQYDVHPSDKNRYILQPIAAKSEIQIYVNTCDDEYDFYYGPCVLYHIDNKTLNVTDTGTFDGYYMPYARGYVSVNDSLTLRYFDQVKYIKRKERYFVSVDFLDTKNHTIIDSLNIDVNNRGEYNSLRQNGYMYPLLDYVNDDSIYIAVPEYNSEKYRFGMSIVNFSLNKKINFRLNLTQTGFMPLLCRATSDGGCIVLGTRCNIKTGEEQRYSWLKFNNDGTLNSFIESVQDSDRTIVYPNPTKNCIHIVANGVIKRIELVNISGQTVYSSSENSDKVTIPTNKLPKGNYVVTIQTDQTITHKNIVIE